eukprot:CAMPEP_0119126212 /NCGR_PEP_ID=MMETSP1310-20130426/5222_1 /TAXON_ID=464262 /ORGANISM="Genus nov. species nov., Strain RCC2339" /LENGTH=438 /DNA_ID=CAMNT_0007116359 /DNA_START=268 /DNA_END=1581 /DNA_ORIENTATION=+
MVSMARVGELLGVKTRGGDMGEPVSTRQSRSRLCKKSEMMSAAMDCRSNCTSLAHSNFGMDAWRVVEVEIAASLRHKVGVRLSAGDVTAVGRDAEDLIVVQVHGCRLERVEMTSAEKAIQNKPWRRSRAVTFLTLLTLMLRDGLCNENRSNHTYAFAFYVGDGYHIHDLHHANPRRARVPVLSATACASGPDMAVPYFGGSLHHDYTARAYDEIIEEQVAARQGVPWIKRKGRAVFRGNSRNSTARANAVEVGRTRSDLVDAGKDFLNLEAQQKFKYQIGFGRVKGWADRNARLLHSNSVLILERHLDECVEWWEPFLEDGVSVVRVDERNNSYLIEKIEWLQANDEIAHSIADCSLRFAQQLLTTEGHMRYLFILLNNLMALQDGQPRVSNHRFRFSSYTVRYHFPDIPGIRKVLKSSSSVKISANIDLLFGHSRLP